MSLKEDLLNAFNLMPNQYPLKYKIKCRELCKVSKAYTDEIEIFGKYKYQNRSINELINYRDSQFLVPYADINKLNYGLLESDGEDPFSLDNRGNAITEVSMESYKNDFIDTIHEIDNYAHEYSIITGKINIYDGKLVFKVDNDNKEYWYSDIINEGGVKLSISESKLTPDNLVSFTPYNVSDYKESIPVKVIAYKLSVPIDKSSIGDGVITKELIKGFSSEEERKAFIDEMNSNNYLVSYQEMPVEEFKDDQLAQAMTDLLINYFTKSVTITSVFSGASNGVGITPGLIGVLGNKQKLFEDLKNANSNSSDDSTLAKNWSNAIKDCLLNTQHQSVISSMVPGSPPTPANPLGTLTLGKCDNNSLTSSISAVLRTMNETTKMGTEAIIAANNTINTLESSKELLDKSIEAMRKSIDSLNKTLEHINELIASTRKKIEELESKGESVAALTSVLNQYMDQAQGIIDQVSDLESKVNDAQSRSDAYGVQIEEAKNTIEESTNAINTVTDEFLASGLDAAIKAYLVTLSTYPSDNYVTNNTNSGNSMSIVVTPLG